MIKFCYYDLSKEKETEMLYYIEINKLMATYDIVDISDLSVSKDTAHVFTFEKNNEAMLFKLKWSI